MPDLDAWVTGLAGSPWALVAVLAATAVDGFFPPVPSESVVIALAALSAAGREPTPWVLGAVAALGAFIGDQVAYALGRRFPVRTSRMLRSDRAQAAVARAERALATDGAAFIIGGRFVPVGRVAVSMTAGAVGFSRRRFRAVTGVAALLWSSWTVALGYGAGHLLDGLHPLVGVGAGVAGGLVAGVVLDRMIRRLRPGPGADGSRGSVTPADPAPTDDAAGSAPARGPRVRGRGGAHARTSGPSPAPRPTGPARARGPGGCAPSVRGRT